MLNLTINENKTVVQNCSTNKWWQFETTEFFGVIYEVLEKDFQGLTQDKLAANIITHVKKGIRGDKEESPITLFDSLELGKSFYELQSLISDKQVFNDGRYSIALSLKEVEEMRLRNNMTASYLPVSIIEERGMSFTNLKTQVEVLIAVLFYYAFHGYKLARCKHCGRWFATMTLKEEYCKRISPCFGSIITGAKPLSCEQAVRNIMQKHKRRQRNIREYLVNYAKYDYEIEDFKQQSKVLRDAAKAYPTVENLTKYDQFLYDDRFPRKLKGITK